MAHAYTRYLGDLSGGQVLGRIAQKSMGLKSSEGLSFFAFPGVSSPNLFKQLYRSRMNSVELTEEQRNGVLEEAVRAFEFNIQVRSDAWAEKGNSNRISWQEMTFDLQVFDDIEKLLDVTENKLQKILTFKSGEAKTLHVPLIRMVLGLFLALATVSVGFYAL